jgi:hypothetical protein
MPVSEPLKAIERFWFEVNGEEDEAAKVKMGWKMGCTFTHLLTMTDEEINLVLADLRRCMRNFFQGEAR